MVKIKYFESASRKHGEAGAPLTLMIDAHGCDRSSFATYALYNNNFLWFLFGHCLQSQLMKMHALYIMFIRSTLLGSSDTSDISEFTRKSLLKFVLYIFKCTCILILLLILFYSIFITTSITLFH